MFVEFITNNAVTSSGWSASYNSVTPDGYSKINAYEYWFDYNYAAKVSKYISPVSICQFNKNIITYGLTDGLHTFHIRLKDNSDQWSSVVSEVFYNKPPVTNGQKKIRAYEYWFDNDHVSKASVNVTPVQTYSLIDSITTSPFLTGLHNFHIRFADKNDQWSSVISEVFYKKPPASNGITKIKAYEYWYDNDYASKTLVNVTPVTNSSLIDSLAAAAL